MILATVLPAAAQTPSTAPVHVFVGKVDADGLPISAARLCIGSAPSQCFAMPSMSPKGEKPGFYQFGFDPHWKVLRVPGGKTSLLFSATFSGGGSGTLTRYAILRADERHITNLLPEVALTNASEEAVWKDSNLSPYPVLVTADFDWDMAAGETHFAKHRYFVNVYRFDTKQDVYVNAITYRTSKKYDSLDDADTIHVIAPERSEILRRLNHLVPNP